MRPIVVKLLLVVLVGANLGLGVDWHIDASAPQVAAQDDGGGLALDHNCHSPSHFVGTLGTATERSIATATLDQPAPAPSFRNLGRSPPVPPPSSII